MIVGICIGVFFSGLFCLASSVTWLLYLMAFQHCFSAPPVFKPSTHDVRISSLQMLHTPKAISISSTIVHLHGPLSPSLCLLAKSS